MWYNTIIISILKSPFHRILSGNTAVITYSGHKSGKTYHVPFNYVRAENTYLSTSIPQRTWWRNLRKGAQVQLLVHGKTIPAYAQVLSTDDQKVTALRSLIKAAPMYARYMKISFNAAGEPDSDQIRQAAAERVLIRFTPAEN